MSVCRLGYRGIRVRFPDVTKKVFFQIKVTKGWRKPAPIWVHYTTSCNTQSNTPEDGRDQRSKHVELIGIINKRLLLHLVGVYIIHINDARSNKYQTFLGICLVIPAISPRV